jgi:hypothetical protein
MGKNSVSPSIIAIMIACNVFMKMYVVGVDRPRIVICFGTDYFFRTFQDSIYSDPKTIKTVVGAKRIRLKLNIASLKQQDITPPDININPRYITPIPINRMV